MTDLELLPPAWRTELLYVAVVKRWLLGELPVADRLHMLEWLAARSGLITQAVVAAIQPACDTTMEIVAEARRSGFDADDHGAAMFAVLEHPDVMSNLSRLNSSMAEAIRLCQRHAVAA